MTKPVANLIRNTVPLCVFTRTARTPEEATDFARQALEMAVTWFFDVRRAEQVLYGCPLDSQVIIKRVHDLDVRHLYPNPKHKSVAATAIGSLAYGLRLTATGMTEKAVGNLDYGHRGATDREIAETASGRGSCVRNEKCTPAIAECHLRYGVANMIVSAFRVIRDIRDEDAQFQNAMNRFLDEADVLDAQVLVSRLAIFRDHLAA